MSGDFFVRQKFKWSVQVQQADGEIVDCLVENLWDPKKDYVIEAIKGAAAAEHAVFHARRGPKGEVMPCSGVSAVLLTEVRPGPGRELPAAA